MRISHEHRFVFFASPKTGSRSVRKLLDAYAEIHGRPAHEVTADFPFYNHMRPVELRDVFSERGWDFDAYFKFVMVRNPWSRLVSLYEMFAFREGRLVSRLRRRATRHRGFRAWVRACLRTARIRRHGTLVHSDLRTDPRFQHRQVGLRDLGATLVGQKQDQRRYQHHKGDGKPPAH